MDHAACPSCRVIGNFGSVAGADRLAYLRNERPGNLVSGEFADHNDFTEPAQASPSPPHTTETPRVNGLPPSAWGVPNDSPPLSPRLYRWGESPTYTWSQTYPAQTTHPWLSPTLEPAHGPNGISDGAAASSDADNASISGGGVQADTCFAMKLCCWLCISTVFNEERSCVTIGLDGIRLQ